MGGCHSCVFLSLNLCVYKRVCAFVLLCVCVCVCVRERERKRKNWFSCVHSSKKVCVCVSVYVCVCVCGHVGVCM